MAIETYLVEPEKIEYDHNRTWDIFPGNKGVYRLIGVAGSGVTSMIIDSVLARLKEGVSAQDIIVISSSKESATRMRSEIQHQSIKENAQYTSEEPIVRSIHSFAFEILADHARRNHNLNPRRLISGSEQDAVIRDMLQGHHEAGGAYWPEDIAPAISYKNFARALRDFLLRAVERNYSPDDLEKIGKKYQRPRWVAAGHFLREYENIMGIQNSDRISASELITIATELLTDPDFLSSWRNKIKYLYIDDAQNLDPLSAKLLEKFIPFAESTIIAGDPNQSIFHFRGAHSAFLEKYVPPTGEITEIFLDSSFRQPSQKHILIAPFALDQYRFIADRMRRAHLLEGMSYKDMAVIVRSSSSIERIRRVFLQNNIPVALSHNNIVLIEQPLVESLLIAAKSLLRPLGVEETETLVCGPIGGADSIAYSSLIRAIRREMLIRPELKEKAVRAVDVLRNLLNPRHQNTETEQLIIASLGPRERAIFDRIMHVVDKGYAAVRARQGVELIFWALWEATGLDRSLQDIALRGGARGSQASRDLDSMLGLFDALGDYVERQPGSSVEGFIRYIEDQELPVSTRDRRGIDNDAVSIITAHSAPGQEWKIVFVADVNEGVWPNLELTGSIFSLDEFLDYADRGIEPGTPLSRIIPLLKNETQLFDLACSRATDRLFIMATDESSPDSATEPSRFCEEYGTQWGVEVRSIADFYSSVADSYEGEGTICEGSAIDLNLYDYINRDLGMRVFSNEHLIAELRRIVCGMTQSQYSELAREDIRKEAAVQLKRLAEAGIVGADPSQWQGIMPLSTHEPVYGPQDMIRINPSGIEALLQCPLNYFFRNYISTNHTVFAGIGTLVHAYAEALTAGLNKEDIRARIHETFASLYDDYIVANKKNDLDVALDNVEKYVSAHPEVVATEFRASVEVPASMYNQAFKISGRIDRLEYDKEKETYRIIDFKTGDVSKNKVGDFNPQLATYILAAHYGSFYQKSTQDDSSHAWISDKGSGGVSLVDNPPTAALVGLKDPKKLQTYEYDGFQHLGFNTLLFVFNEAISHLQSDEIPGCGKEECAVCSAFGLVVSDEDGDK